ncbi:reverse transcriptase domain-containing protein [Tanacetum coccineum]
MSTRSTSSNLFSPLRDPESLIRQRNLGEPSSLFNFEEVMSIPHNNQGPPPAGPPPPNNNGPPPLVRPNGPTPQSMEELCQPFINGRGGPIAPIPIQAMDFGLRHHMIQQVQNTCQFHGLPGDDANRHIEKFLEITQHMKQNGVSDDALRLSIFPYSLTHHAYRMIDTFYNGLTLSHRDTINAAAGGTFMQKTPEECYELIENMTAHHNHWDTSTTRVETSRNISSTTTTESPEVVRQLEKMNKNFLEMMRQIQLVKSFDTKCETCGGPHSFTECPAVDDYTQEAAYATTAPNYQAQVGPSNDLSNYIKTNEVNMRAMQNKINNMKTKLKNEFKTLMTNQNNEIKNILSNFFQMQNPSGSGSLPSNTVANPRGDVKAITTRSGVAYDGPMIPPTHSPPLKEVEHETEATKDKVQPTSLESTAHVQPLVVQDPILEPEVAPKPKLKPLIPYPSRLNDQKLRKKANNQLLKFLQIFQRLHFDISFADALLNMPKFASMFKSLLSNKEKLFELANTPLNENCLAVLLKKLPEKLRDPVKFLIPCNFSELDECLALADLGASINLMPLSVWKQLLLPELTSTRMTLELANRSTVIPNGVAEDVFVKVGKFYFLADFVVVDYDVDPRVPLILGRPFLRTARALIDVHVLGVLDSLTSGNPTPSDPIIASSSPSFTSFEGGDFILEEIKACLSNDSIPLGIDDADFDPEGDIRLLEKLLNDDPSLNLPPLKNDNLKQVDVTMTKPSIEEPSELELKDLPSHLEDAFL